MMKLLKSQKGNVVVITALSLSALIGFTALVIDVGLLYFNRIQLTQLVDASALAGASQFLPDATSTPSGAANDYAARNGLKAGDRFTVNVTASTVTVTVDRTVNFILQPFFGRNTQRVSASATAAAGALRAATGVVPFGVEKQEFTYGQSVVLKAGGGSGDTGNYGALALGGTGAKTYEYNIINGYSGELHIGMKVSTETGNMSGPTNDGVNTRIDGTSSTFPPSDGSSPRIVTIPVLETLDVNGRKDVTIVGFASFFLESVGGSGQDAYVIGRFMKMPKPGEITSDPGSYYGLYNVKLIAGS